MSYVDGFLLAVPKKKLEAYRRIAQKAGKVWMEHGALAYVECAADAMPFDAKRMIYGGFKSIVEL
jgi:uncharacterized protein YbaA (DUF1428 family)